MTRLLSRYVASRPIPELTILQSNETPDICGACGGKCCTTISGTAHPNDFGAPDKDLMLFRLTAAFASGKWSIDWFNGDPHGLDYEPTTQRTFFIRPGLVGVTTLRDAAHTGICKFWRPTRGCTMKFEERPYVCRSLVANNGGPGTCIPPHLKMLYIRAWIPYQEVIEQAAAQSGVDSWPKWYKADELNEREQ